MVIEIKKKIIGLFRSLCGGGFFHIVGAGTLNRAISTILSIVLVRVLSKSDYGVYAYAFNIISFFVLFNGLGASSAALQLCCEHFNDRNRLDAIYKYAYLISAGVGIVFSMSILLASAFAPLSIPDAAPLLALYCFYPLLQQLCDIKAIRLRVLLKNQEYALATNVQTVLLSILSIVGAMVAGSIGLVIGESIALLGAYVYLCLRFPFPIKSESVELRKADYRQYWSVSLISAFNNGVSQALTLLGNFLIASLTANELVVSSYKVATTIPFALLFFPSAIITYVYPHFVQHKDDREWTQRNYLRLTLGSMGLMGALSIFCILFAAPITSLVFGSQYLDAVPTMRLLMIGFFLTASFRTIAGNLLVTQRKLIANSITGIILVVTCAIGSYLLIPKYGMLGAAAVYDACMLVGSIITTAVYISVIRKLSSNVEIID